MTETEMTHEELVDAYRARLATIGDQNGLTAECVGAVFYGGIPDSDNEVGTILGIKFEQGWGLFGPMVYAFVKLCHGCVHNEGGDNCLHPSEAEWQQVIWLDEVRRNGDAR